LPELALKLGLSTKGQKEQKITAPVSFTILSNTKKIAET
jgi:hypothetical protein